MNQADQGRIPSALDARGEPERAWVDEPPEALVGKVVDQRYRVEALLARGGMGAVYRAEQAFIGRKVALKVLHDVCQRSPEVVERFRREAQIAVQLKAPNVVEVLDFGRMEDGRFYLAMELLEGESLQEVLARDGALPPSRAVPLLRQLLDGLVAVHAAGVVHRDLKPENLWLMPSPQGERLKIIDFGIARLAELPAGASRTQVGLVMGTPEFIAPEQLSGGAVDARADLYAVGLIAWLCLCGRHPFPTADVQALMQAQAFLPVPRLRETRRELAAFPRLEEAIARATAKAPAERVASAQELRALLEGAEVAALDAVVGAAPSLAKTLPPLRARGAGGMPGPPAERRALVFSEVVGFDEWAVKLPRRRVRRLRAEHDKLLAPVARAFGGRRDRSVDGARRLFSFTEPRDALCFAMALQDQLARRRTRGGGAGGQAPRVGVHVGAVLPGRSELFGEAVDLAARVLKEAGPGEVWLSPEAQRFADPAEVSAEPMAARAIEGLAANAPLYRLLAKEGPLPFGGVLLPRVDLGALARAREAVRAFRRRHRRALRRLGVGALAMLACAAGAAALLQLPTVRASRALSGGRPRLALEALAGQADSPQVLLLRARALHALQRYDEEMASYAERARLFPASMARPEALAHLVDHLGGPASGRAQEVLAQVGSPAVGPLVRAAVDKSPRRRWAALEVLRGLGEETRADRAASFIADLDLRDCAVVTRAARRLAELGDVRAIGPLRAVAIRKSGEGGGPEACEAPAARAALKKLGELAH